MYCRVSRVLLCCMALFSHSSPKNVLERIQRNGLKIILGKDYVGYISALESCELQKGQAIPLFCKEMNENIVISSLLQFTHMNINYATRNSIMLIMSGQKNIENLLFHIFRG